MSVKEEDAASSSTPDLTRYPYLAGLNAAQLKAVTASPDIPLQILAGPGSGKTRVLTSRVAYLVQHHGYKPFEITAVTFTNKAAQEMTHRLEVLLGVKQASDLILGTFHATCAKYLRRYGGLIGLANNFAIADADDCKKIMSGLLKAKAEYLEASRMQLKDRAVLSEISKAKAKGESPDDMAIRAASDPSSSTSTTAIIAELYAEYEAALQEANSLDFDDLLVYGVKLFKAAPRILETCKHILVDEFQDTNTTQYELMKCFAAAHGGVSVVGDPDQSIYGWRSAEIENLNRMTKDFPGVEAIYLETNYRSTGSILKAAHSVVSQDRERIPKNLIPSHPVSSTVTLKTFSTPVIEASFIATEIKRLIAYSGGVLNYDDFAILLRYNALSRVIESALQKDSIPNRIVGGHKFFERMEIKDMLAYLQLAENPNFTPAFIRVVNVPKRSIGDKSVADLLAAAKKQKVSPMQLCEDIIDGDQLPMGIKPAVKKNLAAFVGVVRKLRRAATKGSSVADLIRMAVEKTGYEQYLQTSQPDWESRWENVQELISYSVTVAQEQLSEVDPLRFQDGFTTATSAVAEAAFERTAQQEDRSLHPMFRRNGSNRSRSRSISILDEDRKSMKRGKRKKEKFEQVIEVLSSDEEDDKARGGSKDSKGSIDGGDADEVDVVPDEQDTEPAMTPLSYFLQTSMLSSFTEGSKEEKDTPKVTITTVHAAKGLEWPVVFIPAVEQGTYPSYRCTETHEIAEERRLLYVAMTRAQAFLIMSSCQFRMTGGEESDKDLSEFIKFAQKSDPAHFSSELASVNLLVRRNVCKILHRPDPDEDETKEMIMKHVRSAPPLSMWDAPDPQDRNFNRFARREVTKAARAAEYWASDFDEYALPGEGGNRSRPTNPHNGYTSAKSAWSKPTSTSNPGSSGPSSPSSRPRPPAPVHLPGRLHHIPAPLPFTFGVDPQPRPQADILGFANASKASLDLFNDLGLPDDGPARHGDGEGKKLVSGFEEKAKEAMSEWDDLGLPDDEGSTAGVGGLRNTTQVPKRLAGNGIGIGNGNGIKLAGGTKRLGMGRPVPWGAKKPRQE